MLLYCVMIFRVTAVPPVGYGFRNDVMNTQRIGENMRDY